MKSLKQIRNALVAYAVKCGDTKLQELLYDADSALYSMEQEKLRLKRVLDNMVSGDADRLGNGG